MALKRWLGALLIVSVFGIVGCSESPKDSGESSAPAQTATEAPAAQEAPGEDPGAAAEPAAPVEVADRDTLLADLAMAEGMDGYDEVKELEVPDGTPEIVAEGKELYLANCALCHGDTGAGDGAGGAALDPPPRDLTDASGYLYGHLELGLYRTGMYGVPGTGMAPWEGILSEDEQWAIGHYIRTIQK